GGGLFLDLASHVFDALDYLTGAFQDVKAHAANLESAHDVEDIVGVTWRSERGAIGTSMWNFAAGVSEDVIEVTGTDGRVAWSAFSGGVVTLTRGKEVQMFDAPYPPHVHQPLVQTIVDELLGRGKCPSTGETAMRTQAVMDQCLTGYYGDRSGAFWEHPHRWPGRRSDD
ncbi:MAG TPA: Gfo/Idh/MocA family oxidoreductase, partial [Tepidisphaeraceae bacterium]